MKRFPNFTYNNPPNLEDISFVVSKLNIPHDYETFLKYSNGGSGFIGDEYLEFTKAEDLVKINDEYQINDHIPGIILIGNNGGSEAIAIDMRNNKSNYILLPFIFEEDAIVDLGTSFEEMISKVETNGFFE